MEPETKIALAIQKKDLGNSWYRSRRYNLALKRYNRALEYLEDTTKRWEEKFQEEVNKIKVLVCSNLAAVYLKTQDYAKAEANCNLVCILYFLPISIFCPLLPTH